MEKCPNTEKVLPIGLTRSGLKSEAQRLNSEIRSVRQRLDSLEAEASELRVLEHRLTAQYSAISDALETEEE